MNNKRIPAFVLRSVLLACLAVVLTATVVAADGTTVLLRRAGPFDEKDYIKVVLNYGPDTVLGGYKYVYEVTNHSTQTGYLLDTFNYTCLGVSDPATAFLPLRNPTWIAPPAWGSEAYQYADCKPWLRLVVETIPEMHIDHVPGVQLSWMAHSSATPVVSVLANPSGVNTAAFGFTSPFAIANPYPLDIGTALVMGRSYNGETLLYGPYDSGTSTGGAQVPEWPSMMLGLIGLGGMGWRFRRR